jgi:hypothetical protein
MAQLTHEQYEWLERAVRQGTRIVVHRRGSEYIVIPKALRLVASREAIDARNPSTGDDMTIYLDEIDAIEVVR